MDAELTFGQWLRRHRKAQDMTQTELAAQIYCAAGTLRKLEADERLPSKDLAVRVARYFAVPDSERAAFVAYARGQADMPPVTRVPTPGHRTETPPNSVLPSRRHNLPLSTTAFVGREREIAAIRKELRQPDVRLLTLTGPGGIGKTRLALQVAVALLDNFSAGVWFVDLAPIRDPALVPSAIATTLQLPEPRGHAIVDSVQAYLRDKQILLILDNFEQVVAAAQVVADLLAAAPLLRVLVTSRVVLGVYGEYDVAVPPLTLPDPQHLLPLDTMVELEAVQLFNVRARAVTGGFALTTANAPLVADLCRRLDGLPLAIELAAARLRHLPLETIVTRLSSRLTLLTGGPRTHPPRQQTLRATIAWSYDLLLPGEQRLLRRLAVFMGGWTVEAAAAVCNVAGDLPFAVLDGLTVLIDHSLVHQHRGVADDVWFTMLETMREYALEELTASGEAEAMRRQHATYYLALGERAGPELRHSQQATWFAYLELEHNNVRAALDWCRMAALSDPSAAELGLRLAVAVWEFWSRRGYQREGCDRLQVALAQGEPHPTDRSARHLRAEALSAAGNLAVYHGDAARSAPLLEESLALFQSLEDPWWIGYVLMNLGCVAVIEGNIERSMTLMTESLTLLQEVGDPWGIAWALSFLGSVVAARDTASDGEDDQARAAALLEESVAHFREVGDIMGLGAALGGLGLVMMQQGHDRRARQFLTESLRLIQEIGAMLPLPPALEAIAALAAGGGPSDQGVRAVHLYAAAAKLYEQMEEFFFGENAQERERHQETIRTLRRHLGDVAFDAAWAAGRAMTVEEAITYALHEDPPAADPPVPHQTGNIK